VEPETYYVPNIGQTFTINISVANVTDLWGWEFELFYSSTDLNGTDAKEGPFLKTAGETFFWVVNLTDNYNATHGYIYAFCILTHVIPGADGTGVIANVTFKSKTHGSSILDLTGTKLKSSAGDYISHGTYDGTVIVKKPGDVNGDGKVDTVDLSMLGRAWDTSEAEPHNELLGTDWNPNCDFNDDTVIGTADLSVMGKYWQSDP